MLGAFHVSARGDLTNWHTGQPDAIPAVGGAMDLATGAKQTFVMMSLLTRDGESKLVPECTYPLTGMACVRSVYTDVAVFVIKEYGVIVHDLFDITFDELQDLVNVPLIDATGAGNEPAAASWWVWVCRILCVNGPGWFTTIAVLGVHSARWCA